MSAQEQLLAVIEKHPLKPFLPANASLLILGSFPPARKRWCMEFFYPNYINDMWRIFGLVFFDDKDYFVDKERRIFRMEAIMSFLNAKGIALYDTACAVRRLRNTASDKDLEIVRRTNLDSLLERIPLCANIIATGQKATDVLTEHFSVETPKVGKSVRFVCNGRTMRLWRMPSSSRAYPLKLDAKAEFYRQAFSMLL